MTSNVFRGTIPALMTPCRPDRSPDFDALARRGRALVDAGMSAVVYCGSMGDWPLLTDEQRMQGVERLVAAGVPVIVGTGAQNPARAAALAAHARKAGARGLMVIPRVLSRGPSAASSSNLARVPISPENNRRVCLSVLLVPPHSISTDAEPKRCPAFQNRTRTSGNTSIHVL